MVKKYLSILFSDIFLLTLCTYTGILFVELLKKGSVANYVNTTYLVLGIIVSGAFSVVFSKHSPDGSYWSGRVISLFVGVYIGIQIFIQTQSLGWWSALFAGGGFLITAICGLLMGKEKSAV